MRARTIGVSLIVGLSCGDGSNPFEVRIVSEHFRFHARTPRLICPGITADLEEHASGVLGMIGRSWPQGRVVEYYAYDSIDDFIARAPCGEAGGGCYYPSSDQVHSSRIFHNHELIHAYFEPIGNPPRLYREGIAETIDCTFSRSFAPSEPFRSIRWEDLIALPEVPGGTAGLDYYQAAHRFVRELIDRFGMPMFVAFYEQARANDETGFRGEFESFFGVGLETTWRTAIQKALLNGMSICPCRGDVTPADGISHTGGNPNGCGYNPRLFDLAASGAVVVDVNKGSPIVMSCEGRLPVPTVDLGNSAGGIPRLLGTYLEAGRYFLALIGPDTPIAVTPTTTPWLGETCPNLVPLDIPGLDGRPLMIAFPAQSWTAAIRVPQPYQAKARILARGGHDDRGFLCRDCLDLAAGNGSCAPLLSDGTVTPVEMSGSRVIGFMPPMSADFYVPVEIAP